MKVIILNGPPKVGKDTFLNLIHSDKGVKFKEDSLVINFSYKWTLCEEVAKRYGVTPQYVWKENLDTIGKDIPSVVFSGKSVRQALIYESEEVIKVQEGDTGVAIRTFKNIKEKTADHQLKNVVLLSADGGFNSETNACLDFFGLDRKDMLVIRIDKPGHTYERFNDSREYIDNPDIKIQNDGAIEDLLEHMHLIQTFIDQE